MNVPSAAACAHTWGMPTRLPRGTQQQCSRCRAWRILGDDDREVILSEHQIDRAIGLLRTERQIADLPETES